MFYRWLYSGLFYLIVPLIVLRLLIRGLKVKHYFQRWPERFGVLPKTLREAQGRPLWLHSVSVGEFVAAIPIIRQLMAQYPERRMVITTMTPTGSERVKAVFGHTVEHFYLPYDLPHIMASVVKTVNPCVLVIMETEIWPNLIHYSHRRGIPVLLVNARMSERSARGYQRFAHLTQQTLEKMTLVGAQNPADAERFIDLGALPQKTRVMGNVKFDLSIPASLKEQALAYRHQWGINRPVWIAASTHEIEDERIITLHKAIKEALPEVLLVIVPRHPERFDKVAGLVKKAGLQLARRTRGNGLEQTDVFLIDTMGELMLFLSAADVAFVGGSLVASGGHNLLEPAALGLPVLFGPHMFNFSEVTRLILAAEAGEQVQDDAELVQAVVRLLQDSSARARLGERGMQVVEQNKGAITMLVSEIEKYVH